MDDSWIGPGDALPRVEAHLPLDAFGADETILFLAAPLRRERVRVAIAKGRFTLSGTVRSEEQRVAVEQLIGGARCAQREAGFGDVLLIEADVTEIRAGAEGLQALVAYPAPAAEPQYRAPGATA